MSAPGRGPAPRPSPAPQPEPLGFTEAEFRRLKAIVKAFSASELRALKRLAAAVVAEAGPAPPQAGVATDASGRPAEQPAAPDAECLGEHGNPRVKWDPKFWKGDSYAGALYSDCPSDYLLGLAKDLEFSAHRESLKPDPKKTSRGQFYWKYNLMDAGRARGWARRNRGQAKAPPAPYRPEDAMPPADDGPPPADYMPPDDGGMPFAPPDDGQF